MSLMPRHHFGLATLWLALSTHFIILQQGVNVTSKSETDPSFLYSFAITPNTMNDLISSVRRVSFRPMEASNSVLFVFISGVTLAD